MSDFQKALRFTQENTLSEVSKKQIATLELSLSEISRAKGLLMTAIDKSEKTAAEKALARAQCNLDAQIEENKVKALILELDPERAVTASEKLVKLSAQCIDKANSAAIKTGGAIGVVGQPVSSLFSGIKAGLSAKQSVSVIASKKEFTL